MLTVVTGPPCSGKTTHVRDHARPGDIVIDYDAIAQALGSPDPHTHPQPVAWCATEARKAAVAEALRQHAKGARVWIVQTVVSPVDAVRYRSAGADVVVLDVDRAECHRRAQAAGRPMRARQAIDTWSPPGVAGIVARPRGGVVRRR